MINVSDAVKKMYQSDIFPGPITLTIDGVAYISNNWLSGSLSITESLCSKDALDYSSVESNVLEVTIAKESGNISNLKDKVIVAKQTVNTTDVPLGTYTISDPTYDGDYYTKIKAYDNMKKFMDKDIDDWWNTTLVFPMSLRNLLISLCDFCGITYNLPDTWANSSLMINRNAYLSKAKGSDLLGQIQLASGCFFHTDRSGVLVKITNDAVLTEVPYTALMEDATIADYSTPSIDSVCIRSSDDDIGVTAGTGDKTYVIQENYLLYAYSITELETIAENILNEIKEKPYKPFKATYKSLPYVEIGDPVKITSYKGSVASFWLMFRKLSDDGLITEEVEDKGSSNTVTKTPSNKKQVQVLSRKMHEVQNTLDEFSSKIENMATKTATISKVTVMYLQNTGATPSKEDKSWSATMPTPVTGQTMWSMYVYTMADGTTITKADPINITAQKGEKGDTGVGISSMVSKYQGSADGTTAPTGTWLDNPPLLTDNTPYLWTKIVVTYTDKTETSYYQVTKKGDTGPQGPKGDQGIAGPQGTDGKTQYTHIAYANSADGVTDFTVSDSNRTYIGMYVDFTATDSTKPSDYSWTLIKGANGADGIPGKAGVDGKTPYFHIAYADSADGKDGFYVGGGTNLLIGTSEDEVSGKSYWLTNYQISGGLQPGTTYTFSGWARVDQKAIDNQQHVFACAYTSDWSWSGWLSIDASLTAKYNKVTFTTPSVGQFNPTVDVYLSYPNDDSSKESISGMGYFSKFKLEKGSVATPWSPAPSEAHPIYMGTLTDYTQADSTNYADYTWSRLKGDKGDKGDTGVGVAGPAGADGKTPYTHTAWSWSADGKDRFMTNYPCENLLFNSGNFIDTASWEPDDNVVISIKNNVMDVYGSTLSTYSGIFQYIDLTPDMLGKQFVISTTAKRENDSDVQDIHTIIHWLDAKSSIISQNNYFNNNCVLTNEYSTLWWTDTIPADTTVVKMRIFYLRSGTNTTTYHVSHKNFKYELNNVVTPWVPSPTDDPINAYPSYRGEYTDYTEADSDDPTKYEWALIRGAKGDTGVSIKAFSTEYYLSSSSIEQKDGSWTSVFPTKTPTTYIWYRNLITYTDNTTALSDPVLDSSANNFYTITETNTSNISQLSDRITNEVQSITTVTTQLNDKQTATDDSVSKLQQDTTDSLTNLEKEQGITAQALTDYKNTVTTTYYTKSEIDQQAESVTTKIQQAVEDAQNKTITTLTETVVDARGFTVNTAGADTHTTIDGTGVMVKDAQNNDVANFKASGSEIQKLTVINDASIGAHNTQTYTDYELDEDTMENGDSIVGSADFWIGDVN